MKIAVSLVGLSIALSACTLTPKYERPSLPVAANWPVQSAATADSQLKWKSLFIDPALQSTIQLALDNNRDLRVAAFNIQKARAQYGIQRANLLPSLDGAATGNKSHSDLTGDSESYTVNASLAWELDLFGRIRSLNKAALEDFFSTRESRNAVAISLIGETADAWLNLAADRDLLALTQQTYQARKDAFDIAQGKAGIGTLNDLDLSQARVLLEQARGDVAEAETAIDQDKAALTLLVGATLPDNLLPTGLHAGLVADALPVGMPSEVLLNRPDVLSAEHDLKAANADIGAARAAFFPSISLTGLTGSASGALSDLFKSGTNTWSYGARVNVPIFAGGANVLGLRSAKISRDIAVARYEQSIQAAFSDVSQALAVRARIEERLAAQQAATEAAQRSYVLSKARYDNGADSYLTLLDAQRTLYASQQALINLQTLKASNLAALYRALGDDQSLD